jgi:tetratricopeptide (TPR) repeat protein
MFNEFMLQRDLDEIYTFRGLVTKDWREDTTTFKAEDGLDIILINYAVAMGQLAYLHAKDKDYAEASRLMEIAIRFTPKYQPGKAILGTYYLLNNEPQKAIEWYTAMIREQPHEGEYYMRLGTVYEVLGQFPVALTNIDEGIRNAPEFRQLYIDGFQFAARLGDVNAAKNYVRQWIERHPDDEQMKDFYGDIDRVLREQFGVPSDAPETKKETGK